MSAPSLLASSNESSMSLEYLILFSTADIATYKISAVEGEASLPFELNPAFPVERACYVPLG